MKRSVLQQITDSGAVLRDRVADFLFPPLCIICDEPRDRGNRWLCISCSKSLAENCRSRTPCPKCAQDMRVKKCTCDLAWDHPFDRVVSLLQYDQHVKTLLHYIKYKGFKQLAFDLGHQFASFLPPGFFDTVDCCTVIPLHRIRRLQRGYNQAEWFARGVMHGAGTAVPLADIVRRRKNTRTQTKLARHERQRNLAGAFTVRDSVREWLHGKRVVLIDDVVTTGATTGVCARVMLDAGCRCVSVLSLARD